jgi:GST-like protein
MIMIEVHAYATPNSLKVPMALEEMGLDYRLVAVNLRQGEQKADAFKAMNPNAKVPVLVDRSAVEAGDIVLAESAAILVYLAEKTGQLLPKEPAQRAARSSNSCSFTPRASARRTCKRS